MNKFNSSYRKLINKCYGRDIKMDRIEDAIADFKEGKFVIVVDDEDRENEGDLNHSCRKDNS